MELSFFCVLSYYCCKLKYQTVKQPETTRKVEKNVHGVTWWSGIFFKSEFHYSWTPLIRSPKGKGKWFELTRVRINEMKISGKALQGK